MRTIKFRMWDFGNKTMIDGDSLAFEEYAPVTHLLSQKGIMQYTGLKDENGKEIYEGDIVKGRDNEDKRIIGEVQYRVARFSVNGIGKYVFIQCRLNNQFEIIGNVYQNPELIEESA